jgi:hypothetical protein
MASIEALLGLEIDDEEKTRALAERLRNRQQAAEFFGMSTVAPIAKGAQAEVSSVQDAAETAGGLRQSMAKEAAMQARHADDVRLREEQMALQRERMEQGADSPYMKPGAKDVQEYRGAGDIISQLETMDAAIEGFDEKQMDQFDSPLSEIGVEFLKNYAPEGVGHFTETELMNRDPAVRQVMAQGFSLENQISRLMSGLAVTGYEMKARQNWSPWAQGIGADERRRRMANLRGDFERRQSAVYEMYPRHFQRPAFMDRKETAAAAPSGAETEAAPEAGTTGYETLSDEELAAQYEALQRRKEEEKRRAAEARARAAEGLPLSTTKM